MKRATISDIARECGVSLSTVSLVLNNNPRISEKTRSRVWAAVKKYGYEPNVQARALASRTSRNVSVVVPHLNHVFADIYFGELVSGIYDYACEQGYKVLLDVANEKFVATKEYLSILKGRRADGMLFIASSVADEYLLAFEKTPYPFLLVNHYFPRTRLNYLVVDYNQSARLAAEHLLTLGHRKIGLIAGTNTYTGLDFRDAFLAACRQGGCRAEDTPWEDGGPAWSEEGGFAAAEALLRRKPDLTALMAANDRLAIGALRCLHTRGVRVPDEVSVMGVDDIPPARFTTPGLTTIHHALYDLGRGACERLLALFRGEISSCQDVVPVHLVVRESTGPARRS